MSRPTELQIVDADECDPFDLDLKEHAKRLADGTSRTLANQGLRVLMLDYCIVATPLRIAIGRG